MRQSIILILLSFVISTSSAVEPNRLGMFFAEPFVSQTTNFENTFEPFDAYVVLLSPTVDSVGGYEVGITMPNTVFVLGVDGPNGWTNFGSALNQLVGYTEPLPCTIGGTVLATLNLFYTGTDMVIIEFGPGDPTSIPGHPVIADGDNPDMIIPCLLSPGYYSVGPVASINGWGVDVPIEDPELTVDIHVAGDASCRAGTLAEATLGYDPGLDLPAAPDSRLHFPHPEWAVPDVVNFDEEYQPTFDPYDEHRTFTFEVVTELSDPHEPEFVQITFVPSFEQIDGVGLNLVDRTAGITLPVLEYLEYNYQVSMSETRVFDLMVGAVTANAEIEVGVAAYLDGLHDLGNIARTYPGATDGWDGAFDIPEPAPFPGNYVNATFHHPEWPLGPRFRVDTRASYDFQNDEKVWPLRIETDQAGPATLIFSPNFHLNDAVALSLYDPATEQTINLLPFLRFEVDMPWSTRDLELHIGGQAPPLPNPNSRTVGVGWSMVGLPFMPLAGATLADVLLAGATGFSYIYGMTPAGDYEQLDPATPADQSRGYWLGTTEAFDWQMEGDLNDQPVTVAGREGWNLIGYPIWFPASVTGLQIIDGGAVYDWDAAVAANLISPTVYGYSNSLENYEPITSFQAWNGYWIRAFVDGLEFRFDWTEFQTAPPLPVVGGEEDLPDALDWRVDLTLRSGAGPLRTVRCGVHPDATPGFDNRFDRPEPPLSPSGQDLSFYIEQPAREVGFGTRFRQDLTSPNASPFSWRVVLGAATPGSHTLTWNRLDWPADFDLQIYRPDHNRVLVMSMRDVNGFEVELGDEPVVLEVRTPSAVAVGDVPVVRDRLTAAPNPFNPATTFALDLVRGGDVRVVVYNVRGQRVGGVALGNLEMGRHEVTWQARDERGNGLASGVYFAAVERDGRRVGAVLKLGLVR